MSGHVMRCWVAVRYNLTDTLRVSLCTVGRHFDVWKVRVSHLRGTDLIISKVVVR
jgi:hypothetical protein